MNAPTAEFAQVAARSPAEIMAEWRASCVALEAAKQRESELRREILNGAFGFKGEADTRSGTENFELNGGAKLKAVFRLNYKLDASRVDEALSKIENTGPNGDFIAERLVKFKPELSVSEYKLLPEKIRDIIDTVLTISSGTPSLEYVEPKTK